MNQSIEQLQEEKMNLMGSLDKTRANISRIREIDALITKAKRQALLSQVNGKQKRLRDLALLAWEAESPEVDITTNDGSFHATKIKKFPKLAALKYASGVFSGGRMIMLTINGEKFRMLSSKYEYGKETTYTRPVDFKAFLEENNILVQDISSEEFDAKIEANDCINEEIKAAWEKAAQAQRDLGIVNLNYHGLFSQTSKTIYEYFPSN